MRQIYFLFLCLGFTLSPLLAQQTKAFYYLLPKEKTPILFSKNQSQTPDIQLYKIACSPDSLPFWAKKYWIYPVDKFPKEEVLVPGNDLNTDRFNILHHDFPQWNGKGMTVSLKENAFDKEDVDLKGRIIDSPHAAQTISLHATLMASTIVGGGNSAPEAKGGAWAANIASSDFAHLLSDADSLLLSANISVQNHSYGTEISSNYGAEAYTYDAQATRIPHLLHVFSAGNEGAQGYYSLTGNFKMAKNALTIGAINTKYEVQPYSSKGPAAWGRIKPEMLAYSSNGTSGAAASVSAAALTLQQAYQNTFQKMPPSSLLKALIINSSDKIGDKGINYVSGYGSLNIWKAMKSLAEKHFLIDTFNNISKIYPFYIPPQTKKLSISLAWTDAPQAEGKLVNDLNMRLIDENGNSYFPWCLNPDSIQNPAFRGLDSINTVEQISVEMLDSGSYFLEIQATNTLTFPQVFSLVWEIAQNDSLQWTYPLPQEIAYPQQNIHLRWAENTFSTKRKLAYQWLGDTLWREIDSVFLQEKNYAWQLPDSTGKLRFAFWVENQVFISPTLTIHQPITVKVAFDCEDSMAIFWNKIPEATNYQVFALASQFLEREQICQDTFLVFSKNVDLPARWAVAPVLQDTLLGKKSAAPDYRMQGLDCYFKDFGAEHRLDANINLLASIASTYQVEKCIFEKWNGTNFQLIATFSPNLSFEIIDTLPTQGLNRYRASLFFHNENVQERYAQVYHTGKEAFLIFPNPAIDKKFTLLSRELPVEAAFIQISDYTGKILYQIPLIDKAQEIELNALQTGTYLYQIYSEKMLYKRGILLIP